MPLNRDWVEAAADLAVTASGSHRTGIACPPKKAVRDRAVRLIALHNRHRAGLPIAPPSIAPKGLEPKRLRAREACRFEPLLFDHSLLRGIAMTFPEPMPSVAPFRQNCRIPLAWDHPRLRRAAFLTASRAASPKNALASDAGASVR